MGWMENRLFKLCFQVLLEKIDSKLFHTNVLAFLFFFIIASSVGYSANLQKITDLNGTARAYFISGALWSVSPNYEAEDTGSFPDITFYESSPIFIRLPGGNLLGPSFLLNWLEHQLNNNPGIKPKVILFQYCMSACITFLAGLNKLSKEGKINLELDDDMTIGIHGSVSSMGFTYSEPDWEQIHLIEKHGGSREWLFANRNLFSRPKEDYMAEFKPNDSRLKDSNLVGDAVSKPRNEIVEFFKSLKGFRNQILYRGLHEIDEDWLIRIKK